MIIFFNKQTGNVVGIIEGRLHDPRDTMWIGSKEENDRVIYNWVKEDGGFQPEVKDADQKAILIAIDKKPTIVYDFKVEGNKLVRK